MSHCPHCQIPVAIYVVCVDGRCRHHAPFPDEASAERWAHTGHACHRRHWLANGRFDESEVALIAGILARAGLDRAAAEGLTVTDRDSLLGVAAWSATEDNHWRAALACVEWDATGVDR